MKTNSLHLDPMRDLSFERVVPLSAEALWAAWTRPEHLVHWFTPAPWKTLEARCDLSPGGEFYTVMESPEGQRHENNGCYLVLEENRFLMWTGALTAGYRPASSQFIVTAGIQLTVEGAGTRYRAFALHESPAVCAQHAEMGFEKGWGMALDQLVAYMKAI